MATKAHRRELRLSSSDDDLIDESARLFYDRFGFRDLDGDERGRMFMRIDEAIASFEAADRND